jgi:hypothetical protein
VIGVTESLNYDSDGLANSITGPLREGASLSELYVTVAAKQVDWKLVDLLQELEQDLVAVPHDGVVYDEPSVALVSAEGSDATEGSAVAPAGSERIAQTSQALCSEPLWDWVADDAWFRQLFCNQYYQYCKTLLPSQSHKGRHRHSEASFFNQSFCSTTTYSVFEGYSTSCDIFNSCTYRNFPIERGAVAPRTVHSNYYYKRSRDAQGLWPTWTVAISSDQGNFTGLSHHTWTQ